MLFPSNPLKDAQIIRSQQLQHNIDNRPPSLSESEETEGGIRSVLATPDLFEGGDLNTRSPSPPPSLNMVPDFSAALRTRNDMTSLIATTFGIKRRKQSSEDTDQQQPPRSRLLRPPSLEFRRPRTPNDKGHDEIRSTPANDDVVVDRSVSNETLFDVFRIPLKVAAGRRSDVNERMNGGGRSKEVVFLAVLPPFSLS